MISRSMLRSIGPSEVLISSRPAVAAIAQPSRTCRRAFRALGASQNVLDESLQSRTHELSGKDISIKDNIVTAELFTTASSRILEGWKSPYEATVVKLLKSHGATILSKSDLDEFGMGSHSQTSAHGAVTSPFSRDGVPLSPGGSSGGSAVAVAKNECWAALGTDTGGSVRLPASYSGIVGLKPSYGLLSRWGVIQYANSLDTVGILSREVSVARQVFGLLNQFDANDPSSLPVSTRKRMPEARPLNKALRIGIPEEYNIKELSPSVFAAWSLTLEKLQQMGHSLHMVSLPTTRQALSAYYVLAPAEASSNLAKYDGIRYGRRATATEKDTSLPLYARARAAGFGDEVKRRILLGAYSLSSEAIDNYFIQAQKVRRVVQLDFNKVFSTAHPLFDQHDDMSDVGRVDVLLTPTAPTLPPTIEELKHQDPVEAYMNDVFTVPASLAGLPALSIPVPVPEPYCKEIQDNDMHSAGMQIIGQYGTDDFVLSVGQIVEQISRDAD